MYLLPVLLLLLGTLTTTCCHGFVIPPVSTATIQQLVHQQQHKRSLLNVFSCNNNNNKGESIKIDDNNNNDDDDETGCSSRRHILLWSIMTSTVMMVQQPTCVYGIDQEPIKWVSGKTPILPGQKPKDKSDLKGTKKDPNFLRSIADCKNVCQNTLGPDGLSKPKDDCLSECQDICCTTYEQCTFAIVPRL